MGHFDLKLFFSVTTYCLLSLRGKMGKCSLLLCFAAMTLCHNDLMVKCTGVE